MKNVGKVGMVKRKQFLQKRDFSRSHEVNKIIRKKREKVHLKENRTRSRRHLFMMFDFKIFFYAYFVFPLNIII